MSSERRPGERHPDLIGIEPPDAAATEELVRLRRLKRRLKAGASLVLAAAAGTFLACVKRGDERPAQAPNPMTPEVPNRPAPPRATTDAGAADAGDDAHAAREAGAPDAGRHLQRRTPHGAGPKVDRTEHRKGMPVPDNLLE